VQDNSTQFEKAKAYAFLLLKFRLRSENELYGRLKKKKFDEAVARKTVAFLKEKEFIDDNVFAKGWIRSRIKRSLGLRRIRDELKVKGVDPEVVEAKVDEIRPDYNENEIVRVIAENRFSKLQGVETVTARRRVYAYLMRRGFSQDAIMDALKLK